MNEQVARSLTAFARRLVRPATAVSAPVTARPRYPCTDEEPALSEAEVMMERYGMRLATSAELGIFPTHPLVIAVIKARIKQIGRPVYIGMGGPNLVVWAVESYPNSHQFRMPNGDLLHEQYNEIVWEPVPLATPISTRTTIQQERIQQHWRQTARHSLRQHLRLTND